MKRLTDLSLVTVRALNPTSDVYHSQTFQDVERRYTENLFSILQRKKQIHFVRLCKLYYLFYLTTTTRFDSAYDHSSRPLHELQHWELAQWCACEVVFGHFHSAEEAVERIRLELPHPWSEFNQRCNIDTFEKALCDHCPTMKGSVHDWYNVFMKVPKKLLLLEDFFG